MIYDVAIFLSSNHNNTPESILESIKDVELQEQSQTHNNYTQNINLEHNASTYTKLKSNKPPELNESEINKTLPISPDKALASERGRDDLLIRRYFKQYNFAGNSDMTTSLPVVSTQKSAKNRSSQQHSMASFEGRESRQLSPGQYANYFIGPKLWYIPLFFSIYYLCYVTALIVKAISRHKILFPSKAQKVTAKSDYPGRSFVQNTLTGIIITALETAAKKYL